MSSLATIFNVFVLRVLFRRGPRLNWAAYDASLATVQA